MKKNLNILLFFFTALIMTSFVEGRDHHCRRNKTLFSATYQDLSGLTITGTGNVSQQIANISRGTKVHENSISFNSGTTSIAFPNPLLEINASEGDTIFVNLSVSLNPGASFVSTQPIIIVTSDTKNFSTPQTTSILQPGTTLSNTSTEVLGTDLFTFFTVFPALD